MKIKDFYRTQKHTISFEFFPPKTDDGEEKLFQTVSELKALKPSFVSVTYGAMGNTRANTLRIVSRIKNEIGIEAAAHLTCVAHTQDEIEKILHDLQRSDIENIVALRGDPPKGETAFKPVPGGFHYASELVGFIRQHPEFSRHFSIAVAGYPEGHVECPNKKKSLEHLKIKVDQGADIIITQLFFNNQDYFDFVEQARRSRIHQPIIPGIMPVTQAGQIERFAEMCGALIPQKMREAIEKCGDDQTTIANFGIDYATQQCQELIRGGAAGLHFYTLNKSGATSQIYRNLKL